MLTGINNSLIQSQKSLGSIIKVLLLSKFNKRIKNIAPSKPIVILGTGPSLKATLKNDMTYLEKCDLIGLNHFAEKEEFENLKPSYYVIGAPEIWDESLNEYYTTKGIRLFEALNSKVQWPLTLFVAQKGLKSKRLDIVKKNKNITISFFNNTPIEGFSPISHLLYNMKLGMPRPHNVMIPSIMISIWMGYKTICLAGADHSWHELLRVKDNNDVELDQKHYFDKKENWSTMKYAGKRDRKIHEIFEKWMLAFRGYFDLLDYSKSKDIDIYNISYKSYIDAFERKNIKNCI